MKHMRVTKGFVISAINLADDPGDVLGEEYRGMSKKKAIEAVKAAPGEYIPSAHCDNHDENGVCKGHSEDKEG